MRLRSRWHGNAKGQEKAVHTMRSIGERNPAQTLEQFRKAVPHITVRTPVRPAELTNICDLRAHHIETTVADDMAQYLTDELVEHLHRISREVLQVA